MNADETLRLPEQCQEFAIQCPDYDTVKDRIRYKQHF